MEQNTITISTHNINGFNRSKEFIHSLCDSNPTSIRAIQEHWLRPPYKKQYGVNQLRCLHPDFDGFGTSAMNNDTKITTGRPYGGTGFLYNKMYSRSLKPLLNYSHERVTVLELVTSTHKLLLINAYMPFYNTRDLANYVSMYRDTVGHIENIMQQNPGHLFILLADFNCNIFDSSHSFTVMVRNMMHSFNLVSTFETTPNFDLNSFTRYDTKTNSYTLIDGILISKDLVPMVDNVRISQYGDNVSDHLPVEIDLHLSFSTLHTKKIHSRPYVNWHKLTTDDTSLFNQRLVYNLNQIVIPRNLLHGNHICLDDCHKVLVDNYYADILKAVLDAESVLPKCDPNSQRSFWSSELNDLKRDSINCYSFWRSMGSPKSGPVFECKKSCHFKYKAAIRRHKREDEKRKNDALFVDLQNRDGNSFWSRWNNLNRVGNSIATRINGETDEQGIANKFADFFESVYGNNDTDCHRKLKSDFLSSFERYLRDHSNDDISGYYLSWHDIIDISSKLKLGKATAGNIRPEHFVFGCSELLRHFQYLFNGMIQHGCVPTDFLRGTISPIVKDQQGDMSDTSNYRGITLGCLPAKLFEYSIQFKTLQFLRTDDLQFGFKRKTSAAHAVYTLKSTVEHFLSHGSKVYVAFLDCTKAFDRISHYGLFSKLIERGFPLCFILCLLFWYQNMTSIVKWGSELSNEFRVPLGIKQGGINSPDFFSCYFDDLTKYLREGKKGCFIGLLFLGAILFADDICLLSPTRSGLEKMIDTCSQYCDKFGLSFNPKKSKVMVFSKTIVSYDLLKPITMNGKDIEYTSQIKYLGVSLLSNRGLSFTAENDLRSFYRSANSILNVLNKPDEVTLMHLLYTNCIPILSYCSSVKDFSSRDMNDCNTAVNNAIRKIFSFHRWESIRHLREGFGYLSLHEIFAHAKSKFRRSLLGHHNSVISSLAHLEPEIVE